MLCVAVKVNIGGTVDAKYHMPVLDVVDHNTFTKISVRHRSSVKLEYNITVPESTLRLVLHPVYTTKLVLRALRVHIKLRMIKQA